MKKNNVIDYNEALLERLQNEEFAIAYLNEALKDEDQRVFLLAVKDVIDAKGMTMADIAKKTNLNRQNLYRIFSLKGNPQFFNILSVLNALGINLSADKFKK